MRVGALALAGSAFLGVAALTGSGGFAKTEQEPTVLDHSAQIIKGRQAAFLLSGALFGGMKGTIDRGDDVKGQAFAARSLSRWAKTIPAMFPEGTTAPNSRALPNIWTDRAGFEAKAASYASEASKLAEFAAAGDKEAFAAQWTVVRTACAACHDVHQAPEPKPN